MKHKLRPITSLQVSDLVINPHMYQEALAVAVRHERLPTAAFERLSMVLPVAVAQLEAIGDFHGALALAGVEAQLDRAFVVA